MKKIYLIALLAFGLNVAFAQDEEVKTPPTEEQTKPATEEVTAPSKEETVKTGDEKTKEETKI